MPSRPLSALANRKPSTASLHTPPPLHLPLYPYKPRRRRQCLSYGWATGLLLRLNFFRGCAEFVTFLPEQQEMFIIKHRVWVNSTSFEVCSSSPVVSRLTAPHLQPLPPPTCPMDRLAASPLVASPFITGLPKPTAPLLPLQVTDIAGNPWFRIEGKDAQVPKTPPNPPLGVAGKTPARAR
jgi:hypothetical protein